MLVVLGKAVFVVAGVSLVLIVVLFVVPVVVVVVVVVVFVVVVVVVVVSGRNPGNYKKNNIKLTVGSSQCLFGLLHEMSLSGFSDCYQYSISIS